MTVNRPGLTEADFLDNRLRHVVGRDRFEQTMRIALSFNGNAGSTYPDRGTLNLLRARGIISDEFARK